MSVSALRVLALFLGYAVGLSFCQENVTLPCVPSSAFTDPKTDLRCGKVVRLTTGVIFHKAYSYERLEPNERCVWTLVVPTSFSSETVDIEIRVLHLGFPVGNDDISKSQLILTGISHDDTTLRNRISVNGTGVYRLPSKTRVATLVFSTGDFDSVANKFNGFIIEYEGNAGRSASSSSSGSSNLINNTLPIKFSHSHSGSSHRTHVSTFILPPSRNFYPNQATYPLMYLDRGNDPWSASEEASFSVYNFNKSFLGNPWILVDKFYKGDDTRVIQGHEDIQMIVLRSTVRHTFSFALFQIKCIHDSESMLWDS